MGATLDSQTLRDAMSRFLEALTAHREEIDSLNVFPVPDGDTGTNLLLTQRAVEEALRGLDGGELPEVGETIARAALMGARGNSGVILSQVLRALCDRLARAGRAGARDLAEGLEAAAAEARRAVVEPVEGTMLSVLAEAARAAAGASGDGAGPAEVAEAALEAAERALERTPRQLPELAAAGVVDAGGKGVVLLLDALVSALRGAPLSVPVGPLGPVGREAGERPAPPSGYGYEVMFLLECGEAAVPGLRARLAGLGDSVVVVGGGGLYNVHLHTDEPEAALREGEAAGRPRDVRIASLDERVSEACLAEGARGVRAGEVDEVGVVAVVPGAGAARLLRSLGATTVLGGPGRNPAVADLVAAVRAAPARAVLLLPDHPNVVPAAERAAEEAGKEVQVVPTSSVPEGIAAAAAFRPGASLEENARAAAAAASRVASAEVTHAVRDADSPAGRIRKGDCLGLVGGEVVVVGRDRLRVVLELVERLARDEHEVLTLLAGAEAPEEEAERVAAALGAAHPSLEVELHRGDQPHYPYLIGLE